MQIARAPRPCPPRTTSRRAAAPTWHHVGAIVRERLRPTSQKPRRNPIEHVIRVDPLLEQPAVGGKRVVDGNRIHALGEETVAHEQPADTGRLSEMAEELAISVDGAGYEAAALSRRRISNALPNVMRIRTD
jgi:hypothetical protein